MIRAWKFLQDDCRSGKGTEPPWTVGETRMMEGPLAICKRGYHSSPTPYDALQYASGSMLAEVEISEPEDRHEDKYVSRSMTKLALRNVERELRLWGCDCAERALLREHEAGREPDARSWAAIEVARRYAAGQASKEELDSASVAARAASDAAWAASDAAWAARAAARAASDAARAAGDAARAASDAAWAARDAAMAASDAARAAEEKWQRQRLDDLLAGVEAAP